MKKLEIIIRKLILKFYLLFHKASPKDGPLQITSTDKILLVRLNKIGDALVTTPLIKEIKEQIGCTIDVLADSKNHFIFERNLNVNNTFIFTKKINESKELRKKLEAENYKVVFDLHDDVSTTVTLFLGGLNITNKIGIEKENKKIFTHLIPHKDPSKSHIIERYFEFLNFLKLDYDPKKIRIVWKVKNEVDQFCADFLNTHFSERKFLVGINISAGSEARFWGVDRYKKLISYFKEFDVNILVLSAPGDREIADKIVESDTPLFVDPDFEKFAGMIEKLDMLFTPDTSVVHLASAFDVPMFGIYVKYRTDNTVWYPYNTEHELIITEDADFKNLGFDKVIGKLKPFFESIYNG